MDWKGDGNVFFTLGRLKVHHVRKLEDWFLLDAHAGACVGFFYRRLFVLRPIVRQPADNAKDF